MCILQGYKTAAINNNIDIVIFLSASLKAIFRKICAPPPVPFGANIYERWHAAAVAATVFRLFLPRSAQKIGKRDMDSPKSKKKKKNTHNEHDLCILFARIKCMK